MDLFLELGVLIFSIILHEIAHGWMAYFLGDPTAKYAGRLSLNPIKHMDPWGSVLIPLLLLISNAGMLFGWAKPVPYNPYNLRNQEYGPALVGFAGPLSNILLALLAGIGLRALLVFSSGEWFFWEDLLRTIAVVNIVLSVFNLLPVPPLDGSKLLFAFIPVSDHTKMMLEQYGFMFLFIFVFIFSEAIFSIIQLVLGVFFKYVVYAGGNF